MAKLNLTKSAKSAGIARGTLYNHIKQGKVSCEVNKEGKRVIDTSELMRVYGDLKNIKVSNERSRGRTIEQSKTPKTSAIEQVLRERISDLQQQIENFKQDKETSSKREIELLGIVKQQQILLLPPETVSKNTKEVGFFGRLFGKKS